MTMSAQNWHQFSPLAACRASSIATDESSETYPVRRPPLGPRRSRGRAARIQRQAASARSPHQSLRGCCVVFRLFCDTNPRSGVAWWCNNMAVWLTSAGGR